MQNDKINIQTVPQWFSENEFMNFVGDKTVGKKQQSVLNCMRDMCEQAYIQGYKAALTDRKQVI